MNAFLLTVGISFVLQQWRDCWSWARAIGAYPPIGTCRPLEFLGVRITVDRIVAFAIALVVIGIVWIFLQRTNTGRAIRAVSQDETGAQLVGINLDGIQMLTFSLATATAALAGASLLFHVPGLSDGRAQSALLLLVRGDARRPGQCARRDHRRFYRGLAPDGHAAVRRHRLGST